MTALLIIGIVLCSIAALLAVIWILYDDEAFALFIGVELALVFSIITMALELA